MRDVAQDRRLKKRSRKRSLKAAAPSPTTLVTTVSSFQQGDAAWVALVDQQLDWDLLERELGVTAENRTVLRPSEDSLVFGFSRCARRGCNNPAGGESELCNLCRQSFGNRPAALFPPKTNRRAGTPSDLCLICCTPNHERPADHMGLCHAHGRTARCNRLDALQLVNSGKATPLKGFGDCCVEHCEALAQGRHQLCRGHYQAWGRAGRPSGDQRGKLLSKLSRRLVSGGAYAQTEFDLSEFSSAARTSLLFGLQQSAKAGRQMTPYDLRCVVRFLGENPDALLAEDRIEGLSHNVRYDVDFLRCELEKVGCDSSTEMIRDIWRLEFWGLEGKLDFSELTRVPWLKAAAKEFLNQKLPSWRSASSARDHLVAIRELAETLAVLDPRVCSSPEFLNREVVVEHLERLRLKQLAFENDASKPHFTGKMHLSRLKRLRSFLMGARESGFLDDLPSSFAVHEADLSALSGYDQRADYCRDVPAALLERLLCPDVLDELESTCGASARFCIELQAGVGRRLSEITGLRFDCLDWTNGFAEPTLVLKIGKPQRPFRLEISVYDAEAIKRQQDRIRDQFPNTPLSELALFPASKKNPEGKKSTNPNTVNGWFAAWSLILPAEQLVDAHGNRFSAGDIRCHPVRHAFAQRCIDAGVQVADLQVLLGHESITSTQVYYQISEERRRLAADRVARAQIVESGSTAADGVRAIIDSKPVESLAVPLGACVNPENVAAQGDACPNNGLCEICPFLRTDPPHLASFVSHGRRLGEQVEMMNTRGQLTPQLTERRDAAQRSVSLLKEKVKAWPEEKQELINAAVSNAHAVADAYPTFAADGSIREGMLSVRLPSVKPLDFIEDD